MSGSRYPGSRPAASRLLRTHRITSGRFPPTPCVSSRARRYWPSRFAARTIILHPPRQGSPPNATDYFEAGTRIVWDVDPIAECIHIYRAEAPDQPATFRRGQVVDAEPLLPGWHLDVDWIFA